MPRVSWMNTVQRTWAAGFLDAFYNIRTAGKNRGKKQDRVVGKFLDDIAEQWQRLWPEESILFPGYFDTEPPRQLSKKERDTLAEVKVAHFTKIHSWYYYKVKAMLAAQRKTLVADGIFIVQPTAPKKGKHQRKRAPQPQEALAELGLKRDEVLELGRELTEAALDELEEGKTLTPAKRLSIVRQAMVSIYDEYKDDPEVMAVVQLRIKEYYDSKKAEEDARMGNMPEVFVDWEASAIQTPAQYGMALTMFLSNIETVLKIWSVKTGMSFQLTMGGPNANHPSGKLVVHHFASGATTRSGQVFAQTYPGFKVYQDAFISFLGVVYPKPVRLARAGHPSAPANLVAQAAEEEVAAADTTLSASAASAITSIPQVQPEELGHGLPDQHDPDHILGGNVNEPAEEHDAEDSWIESVDPFTPRNIPIDPALLRNDGVAPPHVVLTFRRPATPAPQVPPHPACDTGAPNSPLEHAFARMRSMAQVPVTGMAPVPPSLPSLHDLNYHVEMPEVDGAETGVGPHEESGGDKENRGRKRKRHGEEPRRQSHRLTKEKAGGSKVPGLQKKSKVQRKSTKGSYFGIELNAWGTGIINTNTGEPVDPSMLPRAEVLALMPDYVF